MNQQPTTAQETARDARRAKFTAGPWTVENWNQSIVVSIGDQHAICWLDFWTDRQCTSQKSHDEQMANAKLIAAAPMLYEACKEALKMAEGLRRETGDAIPGAICWTLNAALAKATPESERTS